MASYPRWLDRSEPVNLREVAPGLFVGAALAVTTGKWPTIIDLYGSSAYSSILRSYQEVPVLLRWQFNDGDSVPVGLLDAVEPMVRARLHAGPVLIHCQAGLSRSASVAYALLRVVFGLDHRAALRRVHVRSDFPRVQTLGSAQGWVRTRTLNQRLLE